MKKSAYLGLVLASFISLGCDSVFNRVPQSCDFDKLNMFMNKYHGSINNSLAGRAPYRDFDFDGKNDFYVVGRDGVIVAQLTSKHDQRWYDLGTNGVWKR